MNELQQSVKVGNNYLITVAVSVLPLLTIFIYYLTFPDSFFFDKVAEITENIPANFSSRNYTFSKTMDIYCKTAPLFSVLFISWNYRLLKLRLEDKKDEELITLAIAGTVLFILAFYLYILSSHDLTASGRLLRIMSKNDLMLALYYITSYAGMYSITIIYLWYILKIYPSYRQYKVSK